MYALCDQRLLGESPTGLSPIEFSGSRPCIDWTNICARRKRKTRNITRSSASSLVNVSSPGSAVARQPQIAPCPFAFAGRGADYRFLRAWRPREPFRSGRERDRGPWPSARKLLFGHRRGLSAL